jgi:hypothetical protein
VITAARSPTFPRDRQLSPRTFSCPHSIQCCVPRPRRRLASTQRAGIVFSPQATVGVAALPLTPTTKPYTERIIASLCLCPSRLVSAESSGSLACRSILSSPIQPACAVSGASWPYPATSPAATCCGRQPHPPPTAPSSFAHFKSSPSRAPSAFRSSRRLTLV